MSFECSSWPRSPGQTFFQPGEVPTYPEEFDGPHVKIVVGLKLRVLNASTFTAVRYYKGNGERGTHKGVIYDSSGKAVASTSDMADSTCAGGQWVTLPLLTHFRADPNAEYMVVVDGATTYALTEGYDFSTPRGHLLPVGGYYGFQIGRMPTTPSKDNYWVDGEYTFLASMALC
jgi:hypothetical protein